MTSEEYYNICIEQQYCTLCTARKDCGMRKSFYSKEYENEMKLAVKSAGKYARKTALSPLMAMYFISMYKKDIERKRQREMELYVEYSPD